jgi:CHAD domain-containing protein
MMTTQRDVSTRIDGIDFDEGSALRPGEPPFDAAARAIEIRLDAIIVGLADPVASPAVAVHNSRKAIKRARAVLRLVRDSMDRNVYRSFNRDLRDVARALSSMRDATIRLDTFDASEFLFAGSVAPYVLAATRECLVKELAEAYPDGKLDGAIMPEIHARISEAGETLREWAKQSAAQRSGDGSLAKEYACLAMGLDRVYRRGRGDLRASAVSGDFNEFHDWRKRVKYLRYQLEHLRRLRPELIDELTGKLKPVDESLGNAHDLWVLGNCIEAHPDCCMDRDMREVYVGITDERRRELDAKALGLGAPLYEAEPRDFVTSILGVEAR